MAHHSLVPIAQRAILQVLNYYFLSAENGCGLPALDQETRDRISTDIQKNLPLAAYAVDKQKAYLEIICDATLPVAQKYKINKRWFYTAVQGITSMELVPSLYENVEDPVRLSISDVQDDDGIANFDGQEKDHDREEEASAQPPALATNVVAPPKNNGQPWSENELQKLIDLHLGGQGFTAIAVQLGRSRNAVRVTWRRVSESASSTWKDYIESKRIAVAAEHSKEVEQASESDDSDESESDEDDEDEAVDDGVANDSTAAGASAVLDPRRPWTDADMRELIDLKFGGMSTSAMAKLMRRQHGSVHCTWVNAAGNTGNKWFKYIHKKFRAEKKKEKQAKASQGMDANGESGSVSISLSMYSPSGTFAMSIQTLTCKQFLQTTTLGKRKRAPSSTATEATAGAAEGI